jgi:N6-adenosine-specific RNA methylase IME4
VDERSGELPSKEDEVTTTANLTVDPDFSQLIEPLDHAERRQLEANIVDYGGARDPLVAWRLAPEGMSEDAVQALADGEKLERATDAEIIEAAIQSAADCGNRRPYPDCRIVGRTQHWVLVEVTGHIDGDDCKYGDWRVFDWHCAYTCERGWDDDQLILIDGHNRLEICTRLNLPYEVVEVAFEDREAAALWIEENQVGRRNLSDDQRSVIADSIRERRSLVAVTAAAAKARQAKASGSVEDTSSSTDKDDGKKGRTRAAVAEELKVPERKLRAVAEVKKTDAGKELLKQVRKGEITLAEARRQVKKAEVVSKLEDVSAREAKALAGQYDVIVIDPPWPMEKIERDVTPEQVAFEYPTMQEDELASMQLPAADDCHVWVWTTHKFLPMCLRLLDVWGLKYVCTFVWHKPGGFQPFGLPQYNCEFAVYARRGTPQFIDTKAFPVCFDAPRGKHSEKPEAFYDVVRRVTAGRRIDIFNRREIDGFDVWGKEAAE